MLVLLMAAEKIFAIKVGTSIGLAHLPFQPAWLA
jgi:hypothetical protein